jgi:hypothetical protein
MGDPEWELELERRVEAEDDSFQKDLDPLESRLRLVEQWMAAQTALSTFRRWAAPISVTVAGLFLNIGMAVATHWR